MNQQRIIFSALDCISKFSSNKYPLKNTAQDIIKSRKLNSSERKVLLDLVFCWSRNRYLLANFLPTKINFFSALSTQEKEKLALNILAQTYFGLELKVDPKLCLAYETYLSSLGPKRHLQACGPWLAGFLRRDFGERALELAESLWQKPAKYLAFEPELVERSALVTSLEKQGLQVSQSSLIGSAGPTLKVSGSLDLDKLAKTMRDHVWPMDAGSQFIAGLIRAKAHDKVLDMCVGEGGKARIIARTKAEMTAIDINEKRLSRARKVLPATIKLICADARKLALAPNSFDWILLDAPCSGTGTIRRHPDIIHRLSQEDLNTYLSLQSELLKTAVKLLKPGGLLVYATCSILTAENEDQISSLLKTNNIMIPASLSELIVAPTALLDNHDLNKNSLLLLPHLYDCDGFFVAVIRKAV